MTKTVHIMSTKLRKKKTKQRNSEITKTNLFNTAENKICLKVSPSVCIRNGVIDIVRIVLAVFRLYWSRFTVLVEFVIV